MLQGCYYEREEQKKKNNNTELTLGSKQIKI